MRWTMILLALAPPAGADGLVAARNIRPETVLTEADIRLVHGPVAGAADHPDLAIGMEARVAIYAGRPIRPEDLGPPAIVLRNQVVALAYAAGTLAIRTEGRSLDRGGVGDLVRVMNLSSRTTVTGVVGPDGLVHVVAPQG